MVAVPLAVGLLTALSSAYGLLGGEMNMGGPFLLLLCVVSPFAVAFVWLIVEAAIFLWHRMKFRKELSGQN